MQERWTINYWSLSAPLQQKYTRLQHSLDCHMAEQKDRWSMRKCTCPRVFPSPDDFSIWKKHMSLVISTYQTLLSPIKSTRSKSCHIDSICSATVDYSFVSSCLRLLLSMRNGFIYVKCQINISLLKLFQSRSNQSPLELACIFLAFSNLIFH